jgi:hypothetical protein
MELDRVALYRKMLTYRRVAEAIAGLRHELCATKRIRSFHY